MTEVFLSTLQKVGMLLIFIAVGYLLRQRKLLPENSSKVLSKLSTMIFCPAYNIKNISQNVTMDTIGQKLPLVLYGAICVAAVIGLAFLLAKLLGRNDLEKRSLIYAFSIPNYGYFGYPIIEGVFGSAMLADVMIFAIPLMIATNTFGYMLFAKGSKLSLKQVFKSPTVMSVFIGLALGLSGIKLPGLAMDVLSGAGSCMSTVAMLLAGFVLGAYPLRKLMKGIRPYLISGIRLLGIPVLFCAVLFLVGLRQNYLLMPLLIFGMPLGLNLVVFPESLGEDASENAKLCFVSYILAAFILPVTFAALTWLANLA